MNKEYKLSVIIPVYNVEEYLVETLDSVVNQTMDNYEIILVNDGSTDNSQSIIDDYAKRYENIVSIYQENSGPGKARNKGIDVSRGEYIIFVDSDDIIPRDALLKRYNHAIDNNADIAVCATHLYDGEKDWPIKNHFLEEGFKNITNDLELLWMMGPCNKIYKKRIIEDIRFPEDINYGEDQVFVLRAYLATNKIYSSKYVGYYYRMRRENGGSLTQQAFVNPSKVIDDITVLWKLVSHDIDFTIKNEDIRENIKKAYFYRLVNVNVWPPLKEAFIGEKTSDKNKVYESMQNLINIVNREQFQKLGKIKKIIFNIIYDNKNRVLNKIVLIKITLLIYFSCKAEKIKGVLIK
ncbi:glycosyltransferase family 2 protein [Clostridium baratii]|uniref:glycosyltransferase family 2 protein n=1 Tax=Clostridium baratii TaxID=1561 RepID=UPI002A7573DE|nr:glycosyltransferase family 2 protein [Clostridium baratii]MDY3206012.1 glycosyltransferase family 2 protein [Clostridium baratii]